MIEALATELLERKALDLILDNAEYEDVPTGRRARTRPARSATVEAQAVPGEMHDPTGRAADGRGPAGDESGDDRTAERQSDRSADRVR